MTVHPYRNPRAEDDAYEDDVQRRLDDQPILSCVQAPTPAPRVSLIECVRLVLKRRALRAQIRRTSHNINYYEESRITCLQHIDALIRRQTRLKAELFYLDHPQPPINRVRF